MKKETGLTKQEKERLVKLKKQEKIKKNKPYTVQESIPYVEIYKDGLCKIDDTHYSKTIQFWDINYQLAQNEDQEEIFKQYSSFLNYFDDTTHIQMTFLNQGARYEELVKNINIMSFKDDFYDIRKEYSQFLKKQMAKGNNGIVKTKYITFTIEAKGIKLARNRIEKLEMNILANFKNIGALASVLDGKKRLEILYNIFNMEQKQPFKFSYDMIGKTGLGTKDFIAPTSFDFSKRNKFTMGSTEGNVSYLHILASEYGDNILADFLDLNENMITNIHIAPINQKDAIKTLKCYVSNLQKMKIDEQKQAFAKGYDTDIVSTDIITYGKEAQQFLEDLESRNQKYFIVTILMMNLADENKKNKLENLTYQIDGVAQKHNCSIKCLDYRQEQGLMSSLPLGVNQVEIERGFKTSSLAGFMPFTTQELFTGGEALYYGVNAVSNNVIMADRKLLKNPNGLILGTPGSGKSFSAKREMLNVYLATKDDIIVCDPESEYHALVNKLHGQVIKISPSSKDYINPLDINTNYAEEEEKILSLKIGFVTSLCELAASSRAGEKLSPEEVTVIDRCTKNIYEAYMKEPKTENIPILEDLYNELLKQEEKEAKRMATILEIYVKGSLNIFNHRTNVDMNKRCICFDIKELGAQLKKIGMLIVLDAVWNRVTINREKKKATRYYVDEVHLLLKDERTAVHFVEIWKRFRKWGGIPTAITQNVKDFLSSSEIENILENSDFVYMLNQASGDRKILAEKLNISPHQLSYVTYSDEGEGLMVYGNVIIPFVDKFPHNSIYDLITTKPSEVNPMKV